jgi:hypothetical protein
VRTRMRHVTICKHDVINLISARYVSSINILVRERLCVIDFFFCYACYCSESLWN